MRNRKRRKSRPSRVTTEDLPDLYRWLQVTALIAARNDGRRLKMREGKIDPFETLSKEEIRDAIAAYEQQL